MRILIPFLQGLYEEFGKDKILNILEKTIKEIAKTQGENYLKNMEIILMPFLIPR